MSRQMPLRREVIVLVAAGAVLGIVYNSMGLASHPPRGIPWVAAETALPSLEDMPADSAVSAPGEELGAPGAPSPAPTSANPATAAGAGTEHAARADRPPAKGTGTSGAPPSGVAPTQKGSGDAGSTPSATSGAVPEPRRAAPLPFIPDSDQPIQVQIATVKRFFDARAALFLDARDPAEYEKGHIPGAIRLTNAEAQTEPQRMKALPVQGRPTIVYCEGGTCEASLELARFLLESGFKKVLVYMGGYPEWDAAGHPVERGSGR
jgi:rhodanese-related sulfurtransferase